MNRRSIILLVFLPLCQLAHQNSLEYVVCRIGYGGGSVCSYNPAYIGAPAFPVSMAECCKELVTAPKELTYGSMKLEVRFLKRVNRVSVYEIECEKMRTTIACGDEGLVAIVYEEGGTTWLVLSVELARVRSEGVPAISLLTALIGLALYRIRRRKLEVVEPVICSNCGAINSSDSLYCWRCGERLEEASSKNIVDSNRVSHNFQ